MPKEYGTKENQAQEKEKPFSEHSERFGSIHIRSDPK